MEPIGVVEWLPPTKAGGYSKTALISHILPDGSLSQYDVQFGWKEPIIFHKVAKMLAFRLVNELYDENSFLMKPVRGSNPKYLIYL